MVNLSLVKDISPETARLDLRNGAPVRNVLLHLRVAPEVKQMAMFIDHGAQEEDRCFWGEFHRGGSE